MKMNWSHSEWEGDITAFEQADHAVAPGDTKPLFIGSSIIRLWDLTRLPDLCVNRGFGGATMADCAYYAKRLIGRRQPKLVVVYAGDNDLAAGCTPTEVLDSARNMAISLATFRVLWIGVKPSARRKHLENAQRVVTTGLNSLVPLTQAGQVLDLYWTFKDRQEVLLADGLHLNETGYAVLTSLVEPYLLGYHGPMWHGES